MPSPKDRIRDRLIVLQCRQGKDEGFESLIGAWERALYYYLRRLLGKEDAVWDALQEVWLRAFQKIHSLRDPQFLGAWLYRIAHNVAMTQLRKAPNWESLDDEEGEANVNAADLATPSEVPEACAAADLHWALDQIPLAERAVLTLHFLEGYKLDEIAEITDVAEGTVKSRMHRAKRRLRAVLEKEAGR